MLGFMLIGSKLIFVISIINRVMLDYKIELLVRYLVLFYVGKIRRRL